MALKALQVTDAINEWLSDTDADIYYGPLEFRYRNGMGEIGGDGLNFWYSNMGEEHLDFEVMKRAIIRHFQAAVETMSALTKASPPQGKN
jgi:hypothetical protein